MKPVSFCISVLLLFAACKKEPTVPEDPPVPNVVWEQTNGPYGVFVNALAVSGTNIFAGTGGGVFLSTNNGLSWNAVNSGLTNLNVECLVVSGSNLFVVEPNGVFLTTDNGTSWVSLNNGLPPPSYWGGFNCLANSGTNLFLGYNTAFGIGGSGGLAGSVFLSTDSGMSWTEASTITYESRWVINVLVTSGTNLFAGTDFGVFLSTNNGSSWSAVNSGLTNLNVEVLVVSGTNLFAGTDSGGVFLSTNNGTSWTEVNSGLTNTAVVSFCPSGSNLFAGMAGSGVFLSTNNGMNWTKVGLDTLVVQALAVSGMNLFAGTNQGVFKGTMQ